MTQPRSPEFGDSRTSNMKDARLPSAVTEPVPAMWPNTVGLRVTVTVNDPCDELPAASVATQDTTVSPSGNVLPEAGVHTTCGETVTASVAEATYVTDLPAEEFVESVTCEGSSST